MRNFQALTSSFCSLTSSELMLLIMSLESSFSDHESTKVEEDICLTLAAQPSFLSSDADGRADEDLVTYQVDFTYPMAVCYEFLTLRDNWTGVLPCQWASVQFPTQVPGFYFRDRLYSTKSYQNGQKPLLAILHSEEVSQQLPKDQAKGVKKFAKLMEIGSTVRSMMRSAKGKFEMSSDSFENRLNNFIHSQINVESAICDCLNEFATWLKRKVFISLG